MQPLKAELFEEDLIVVQLSALKVTCVNSVHPLKALPSIVCMDLPMIRVSMEVQPSKALSSIIFKESGM